MFRPRKLIWLAVIGGIGYLAWRWRQDQVADLAIPATPPPPAPARNLFVPPAPASPPPSGPRRIATRVHRGAPPTIPVPAAPVAPTNPPAPEEPPPALSDPPAVAEQTLAPISAEEAVAAPAEPEPLAEPEQTFAPVSPEEILASEEDRRAADPTMAQVVNINTAELQVLVDLPGIGRSRATRIIAYREQHGPFTTIEQLAEVQGIGSDNINKFRHLITV